MGSCVFFFFLMPGLCVSYKRKQFVHLLCEAVKGGLFISQMCTERNITDKHKVLYHKVSVYSLLS